MKTLLTQKEHIVNPGKIKYITKDGETSFEVIGGETRGKYKQGKIGPCDTATMCLVKACLKCMGLDDYIMIEDDDEGNYYIMFIEDAE